MNATITKTLALLETLNDSSCKCLEAKINKHLAAETNSSSVFIVNILPLSEEAVVQAIGADPLATPVRLSLSEQTIAHLGQIRPQAVANAELSPQIAEIIAEIVHDNHVEAVPVLNSSSYPVLLVCFANSAKPADFLVALVRNLFKYCLGLLVNTRAREEETRLKKQCQSLLTVARKLFSSLGDINELLREIMSEAKRLTNAERCSVFLLEPDRMTLVAKVFDGASTSQVNGEVRIAKDKGVAGRVATTGQLLNIKNAYEEPLFYKGVDAATGFKTRNILCFPIKDETGIVGVAQLCNKMGGASFNYFDEEVAMAFSIYCGLSIMHSLVFKRFQEEQARNKLSNELMMYHMKVSDEDISERMQCAGEHSHPEFDLFSFSPRMISQNESVCFVLVMFKELGFVSHFQMRTEILTKFVMFVERGYRSTPYHNWMHAFSVSHFAYLCLKNFKLVEKGLLTRLEALAYFVSCLCHDIDHRGTNNSFQQQSNSVLASLYSSQGSVMERHHFSQTLYTINAEGCNFLEVLNRNDYSVCLDLIQQMILATDLATHFKLYKQQKAMVEDGYDANNKEHRNAFLCLLMTCADLSDQIKEWMVVKKVAGLIYEEFFTQGDLEKKMGKVPIDMMDREKAPISETQVEFLSHVCLPVFEIFAKMFPEVGKNILYNINRNITYWKCSKSIFDKAILQGKNALYVLGSNEFEVELSALVNNIEKDKNK